MSASRQSALACQALQTLRLQLTTAAGGAPPAPGLLQAAIDDCPEAVLVTDDSARILMANGAAGRLLGMSTRALRTLTMWDITDASDQPDFDVVWKEFLRAGRQRGRYGVRHMRGDVVGIVYCAEANVVPGHAVFVLRRLS